MLSIMTQIINYDVKLYVRKGGEMLTMLGFFLIASCLAPFALGQTAMAEGKGAGIVLLLALLASVISLPAIFQRDEADGTLDQLHLSGMAMEWCVLGKCIANWIACQLPLICLAPIIGLLLGVTDAQSGRLVLALLLVSPFLSAIGAMGSALTLGATQKSGILTVIVLPLYIPGLIFASALAVGDAGRELFDLAEFYALAGLTLAGLPLSCWAAAAILRLQR